MPPIASPPTDPDLFRSQFPVLDRVLYLNAGTEGPVPRAAAEAANARIEVELSSGRCGRPYFEELMSLATELRARYAATLCSDFASVALTGSTTDGVNTVLAGLDLRPGEEIVTTDEEHPGLLAPLARARVRHGITVRVVPWDELAGADAVGVVPVLDGDIHDHGRREPQARHLAADPDDITGWDGGVGRALVDRCPEVG